MIFSSISASNSCGGLGNIYTSLTLSFPEGKLSTVEPVLGETKAFNFADLPCPSQTWGNVPSPLEGNDAALSLFAQNYRPAIVAPLQILKGLDLAWSTCAIQNIGNGYDPPRTLVPAKNLVDPTPSSNQPELSQTPVPKPVPERPGPKTSIKQIVTSTPTVLPKLHIESPSNDSPLPTQGLPENLQTENAPTNDVAPNPQTPSALSLENIPGRSPKTPKSSFGGQEDLIPIIPKLSKIEESPITIGALPFTANSKSEFHIGSKFLAPGGPVITAGGVPHSLDLSAHLIAGSHTITLSSANWPHTARPIITIEGQKFTANSASQFQIATQTLSPGGPAVTVNNVPYSLVPAATALVVAEHTIDFDPSNNDILSANPPILAIGSNTYTANSALQYIIGKQTLTPGGPAVTINRIPYSLAPSPTALIAGTRTIPLIRDTSRQTITVSGNTYTANAAAQYIIGFQTLFPGGPPITVGGIPYSLAPETAAFISNHIPIPLFSQFYLLPTTAINRAIITIGSTSYTANDASKFIIEGKTLAPGSPAIIIHGTKISLGPQGTDVEVIVGSSTKSIGLGRLIMTGFAGGPGGPGDPSDPGGPNGSGGVEVPTTTDHVSTNDRLINFTGGASRGIRCEWGCYWVLVLVSVKVFVKIF